MAVLSEFKCPNCGGAVSFDSDAQSLKCPYCDSVFNIKEIRNVKFKVENKFENDEPKWNYQENKWDEDENVSVFVCNSCGGEIVGDENTASTSCPFCGSPVVFLSRLSGELKPDYVIPFKMDKEKAKANLLNHLKGKKLLPRVFKKENRIEEIKGIYVPFWLFDAKVYADITYSATEEDSWSDDDYDYTETEYYSVERAGQLSFSKVPVDASLKMPNDLMESLEPFYFKDAVKFETPYLAGFSADKYDVDSKKSKGRISQRISCSTQNVFRDTVTGYDTVSQNSASLKFLSSNVKYALYPVWILNTSWKGNRYTFAMNGQTGKFVGNLPCDWKQFWKYFFIIFPSVTVGLTILTTLICYLGGIL